MKKEKNIINMSIDQGPLLSLQHMEGDNKYDPKQALYTKRVRQLKSRNEHILLSVNLEKMTNKLKQKFDKIIIAAKTLEQLDKIEKKLNM